MEKSYLGDAVYVEVLDGGGSLLLTTENGIRVTNSIVLEPQVFQALLMYVDRLPRGIPIQLARVEPSRG